MQHYLVAPRPADCGALYILLPASPICSIQGELLALNSGPRAVAAQICASFGCRTMRQTLQANAKGPSHAVPRQHIEARDAGSLQHDCGWDATFSNQRIAISNSLVGFLVEDPGRAR